MIKNKKIFFVLIIMSVFLVCLYIITIDSNIIENESSYDGYETNEKDNCNEIKQLDIESIKNQNYELVFSFSIDDFIDSFNSYYYEQNGEIFLCSPSDWVSFTYDETPHSKFPSLYYRFQPDVKNFNEPTISVYVPENSEYVQEITLDFPEHGYTDYGLQMYREYCFYTLKALFSDFDHAQITRLYRTLYDKAYDCYIDDEEVPEPKVVYCKDNICLYPYFRLGTIHICIIPITLVYLNELESENVEIYKIDDVC